MVWGCDMWPQGVGAIGALYAQGGGVCLVLCYIPRYLWT